MQKNKLFETYINLQDWCRFYSWVYYNNDGYVKGVTNVSDQTYDMVYNHIIKIEEKNQEFISLYGGSVTECVGNAICTINGTKQIPEKPPIIEDMYLR